MAHGFSKKNQSPAETAYRFVDFELHLADRLLKKSSISTDAMRGRVMSVYNLAFRARIPIGSLGLGKLIPIFGVSRSLAGAGIALASLSVYFLVSRKDETFRSSRSVRL
jgi:hypothetical protein